MAQNSPKMLSDPHFGPILSHFGPLWAFWATLSHFDPTLGHFGPVLSHFDYLWALLSPFWLTQLAFGGTLDSKTPPILLNLVPGGIKAAQVWHSLRPAGYLVAVSGPLCFGSAYSVHVVLFWPILTLLWAILTYFDLFWPHFGPFWTYFELFWPLFWAIWYSLGPILTLFDPISTYFDPTLTKDRAQKCHRRASLEHVFYTDFSGPRGPVTKILFFSIFFKKKVQKIFLFLHF